METLTRSERPAIYGFPTGVSPLSLYLSRWSCFSTGSFLLLQAAQRASHRFSARAHPLLGYTFPSATGLRTGGGKRNGEGETNGKTGGAELSVRNLTRAMKGETCRDARVVVVAEEAKRRESVYRSCISSLINGEELSFPLRDVFTTIYTRPVRSTCAISERFVSSRSFTSVDFSRRTNTTTLHPRLLMQDCSDIIRSGNCIRYRNILGGESCSWTKSWPKVGFNSGTLDQR